jgi:hypothetical protein
MATEAWVILGVLLGVVVFWRRRGRRRRANGRGRHQHPDEGQ